MISPENILKILLAVLLGGLIGVEREYRDKAAGFRTIIFICVGATLYTMFSFIIAGDKDPGRVAANIVTGVGFLGAGVLLRDGSRVIGLTTASIIWLTAAIGMGIGAGQYALAGIAAAIMMVILWFFPTFERWIDNAREERCYELTFAFDLQKYQQIDDLFAQHRLRVKSHKQHKVGAALQCTWEVFGRPSNHEAITKLFLNDPAIQSFKY